ncbi:uncharacterized protein LOC134821425 [Bolinopsis microptera]|uniref:uncharacterized protein LOC134821425 n=1 Tax=Bolinopsis microptera TaxID=2820187 RepID=UPI003078D5AA
MKCSWEGEQPLDVASVSSVEVPGQDDNHSARDIQALLSKSSSIDPPAPKKPKVKWPAAKDERWVEFDVSVSKRVRQEQKGKPFQEKMVSHCDTVYDDGVKWFGLVIDGAESGKGLRFANRRQEEIDKLVIERRVLRRKARKACSQSVKDGFNALLRGLAEKLRKLRRAEARRKKQREVRRQRGGFTRDPFKAIKGILEPSPVGELKCSKEELDNHLSNTYSDASRAVPLGVLNGLPEAAPSPTVGFDSRNITKKEFEEVVKKARGKSSPGNNGIPYTVYKRCPGISQNLWHVLRGGYKAEEYPDNCRYFEGIYIPKADGDFGPSTGRPISLGNIQGKIYLAVLAKRLTNFVVANGYVDLSVQKGGVPGVHGCTEHFGAMWEVLKDARVKRKDLSVVWLDLANAYGAVPHLLIVKALRFYHIPEKVINIVIKYFSEVYGRFSSKTVTSEWQQFEIGIFMGCVISVILFVLCMNLSDEYLKMKVPRSVEYIKDGTAIPPLKLFMDDSCLTTAKMVDMQTLLDVYQEFVVWSRFKLKSSKSRALVYQKGVTVEWVVESSEGSQARLQLSGEVIPNVSEKPIKFLGRWIRAEGKDKAIIEKTHEDLVTYLSRLDLSSLTGLQKCWGYQYMVLPKMKWPLAIYDIPISTVSRWEQTTNSHLRKWLGVGHTLSSSCLFSHSSSVALPIDSLTDTWKVEKCRLLQSYQTSQDALIRAVQPQVRSGRVWKADAQLHEAERDLVCESVRGMVQPLSRAGIGFGDWKKPWEKMSEKEQQREVLDRVKENIRKEREVQLGTLEMQSRWGNWRELVTRTDMSWHTLFKYGDSLIGFLLSAVYGTLVTPALASKWSEDEDGMCKLCGDKLGTVPHILAGCPVALSQGRYRWRHDKVLKQIADQVKFHCERRVNKRKSSCVTRKAIEFVPAGGRFKEVKRSKVSEFGILSGATDWIVLADLDEQLKFPPDIATTRLRPDLVLFSKASKRVIWWELTVPSEERIAASHELKLDRYNSLQAEIQANGWSCFSFAVEVGARGVVAASLECASRKIGLTGRALKKLVRDCGKDAAHCSRWIYLLSRKREWEMRAV